MRMILTLAAAVAFALVPFTASADSPLKTVNYTTAYHQTHPAASAGQYTGVMTLRFYANGIVNGTYRDESAGTIKTVSGGLNGSKLWLSFGSKGGRNFNGTIEKDGTITGTLSNWRGPNVYTFKAVPSTS